VLIRQGRIRKRMRSPNPSHNRRVGRPESDHVEDDSSGDDNSSNYSLIGGTVTPKRSEVGLGPRPSQSGAGSSRSSGHFEPSRDRRGQCTTFLHLQNHDQDRKFHVSDQATAVVACPIARFEVRSAGVEYPVPQHPSPANSRSQNKIPRSPRQRPTVTMRSEGSNTSRTAIPLNYAPMSINAENRSQPSVREFLHSLGCGHCAHIFEGSRFSTEDDLDRLCRHMMDDFSKRELWSLLESKGLKLGDWWKIREALITRGREKQLF
jgi:hypothetical protein